MEILNKRRMENMECIKDGKRCIYLYSIHEPYYCSSEDEMSCGCCCEYEEEEKYE